MKTNWKTRLTKWVRQNNGARFLGYKEYDLIYEQGQTFPDLLKVVEQEITEREKELKRELFFKIQDVLCNGNYINGVDAVKIAQEVTGIKEL